jgi:trans-aconitate 2-methyltransferase
LTPIAAHEKQLMTIDTQWNAEGYASISGLQAAMAGEVVALLHVNGSEHILDVGCGDGKVTAQLAARVPRGFVVGVDASEQMVSYASTKFDRTSFPNLQFQHCDARQLPFHYRFDIVVSINALHWVPDQDVALRSLVRVLKPTGLAQLRLVSKGDRKSLEEVIEEIRLSARWSSFFQDFKDPYLHLTPEEYVSVAERSGLHVLNVETKSKSWNFQSREAFVDFGSVTFVAWLRLLPASEKLAFVHDVIDRYTGGQNGENVFSFYQMDVAARPE